MTRRLLFVRAVNVGGAKLPMAEFREILFDLGGSEVQTYIASGNAILEIAGDPDAFDRAVEEALQHRFGWYREVMSRTPAEVKSALEAYPFEVAHSKFAYVVFLTREPDPASLEMAWTINTGDDCWQLSGREVYVQYARGAGQANPGIDKALRKLGVPGTARNLNTVRKMIELAES